MTDIIYRDGKPSSAAQLERAIQALEILKAQIEEGNLVFEHGDLAVSLEHDAQVITDQDRGLQTKISSVRIHGDITYRHGNNAEGAGK
ncbi:hypothetical protein [Marinobacter salsuginis]|uniref:hypothetical protein n=1 Tax=Marinobacter salsuginis TaxID=418719 RepID=UPI001AE01B22|nr:hypothetical protein [Marinobacter salsuginis]QTN41673.1 hypothetical protein HZ997_18920 [Marinobacter salsuginis]